MIYGVTTISAKANDYTPLDLIFFFLLFYTNPFLNKDSCHVGNFREEYSFFFFFVSCFVIFFWKKNLWSSVDFLKSEEWPADGIGETLLRAKLPGTFKGLFEELSSLFLSIYFKIAFYLKKLLNLYFFISYKNKKHF
jgi:hypothetical protein